MTSPVPADKLRRLLEEGRLSELLDRLPSADDCDRGLCVDTTPADTIQVSGRTRMSLARIYSKTSEEEQLVGQVQVTARSEDRETWRLIFYAHDVRFPSTREFDDREDWWSKVEDLHERSPEDPL